MHDLPLVLLTALASYLIGAVPFGYLIARSRGVDLFHAGSGNIGATNVGRVLGRRFGVLCFILDFAKGALPVVAAMYAGQRFAAEISPQNLGIIAGLAAIVGHMFPVYLKFHGGKGVATAAGVVTMLLPLATLAGVVVWVGLVAALGYVSVGSLGAAVTLCLVRLTTSETPFAPEDLPLTMFCFLAAALVFIRHRSNIVRLFHGNENRLKESAIMQLIVKILHVLAMGLWFGMVIFFSLVVGLTLFGSMEELAVPQQGEEQSQAAWFVVPPTYQRIDEPLDARKEYGSRIAGTMISPMFDWYFLLQGVCGFLAVATAWSWQYRFPGQRVHYWRISVLLAALITVLLGWPLERHVSDLRNQRHEAIEAFLHSDSSNAGDRKVEALNARADFVRWHTYSLLLNFVTIALVTVGMGMAAMLPANECGKKEAG